MTKIQDIYAHEIIDSRGNPTIEVSVLTDTGAFGTASVPSGASTGKFEDVELRDGDQNRYQGMGVLKAVAIVMNEFRPKLIGFEVEDQETLDQTLIKIDDSDNKTRLGANAALGVSIAVIKAAAAAAGKPLFVYINDKYAGDIPLAVPAPLFNLINGGKHGAGNLDFQEFWVIPSTRFSFAQALQVGTETAHNLKVELIHRNAIHSVGDEGGFAPNLFTNSDALELLALVIKSSQYRLNGDVFLGLDVAADSFYQDKKYTLKDSPKPLDRDALIEFFAKLAIEYQLFGLEDPIDQEDWSGWKTLKSRLPGSTIVIGDDLITTNKARLQQAIEEQSISGVIIKPNQIGTLTETIEVVKLAQANKIYTIASHRSGDTNDTFIADFAVGLGLNFAKFGAPNRGERVGKYNRLLEIEQYLASRTSHA